MLNTLQEWAARFLAGNPHLPGNKQRVAFLLLMV